MRIDRGRVPARKQSLGRAAGVAGTPRHAPGLRGRHTGRRLLGWGFCAAGALEVVWIYGLALVLPRSRSPLRWIGVDACQTLGLFAVGVSLLRDDHRVGLPSAATATLLVLDAWFDVTTARTRCERRAALAMAFAAELPVAATCVAVAVRPPARRSLPH